MTSLHSARSRVALRQCGRTTRMIAAAKEAAKAGRAVYIIAANENERCRLEQLIGDDSLGIKVETAGSLGNVQWESMTLRGAHPNCLLMADHYTIESRFRKMLEELDRYNP